ncbi:MAG TPA: ABC transporter permease subunit [Chloroflexota bacterium]|nr:ABC transporter permease subunit [Chloroflexota bacterium]
MATTTDVRPLPYRRTHTEPLSGLALFRRRLAADVRRNRYIYLMLAPVVAYYLIFHYAPMYGAIIAFKDFTPAQGILGSPWIGFQNFSDFFGGVYLWRLLRNTLAINVLDVVLGFPAPIILALLLNELTSARFKRVVQTITYLPHFMSLVVVVGILIDFLARDGLFNNVLASFGVKPTPFMQEASWYWILYVGSGIWQAVGWGSIIYLAAVATVDPTLYEAAVMDGATRWRQMWHITLPGIMPMVLTLLILRVGMLMSVGYEKTLLMYNPSTFDTADVISSYVYRKGVLGMDYGFSAAVGLFNSAINFALLLAANRVSRRMNQTSLW